MADATVTATAFDDLVEYPLQHVFAGTTSDHDAQMLLESIERDGQQIPVEVLPENDAGRPQGTILDGHRRVEALHSSESHTRK